jgi:ankyrin repeat protein
METKEEIMSEMLFEAIEQGNIKEVKGLIALGVDIENEQYYYVKDLAKQVWQTPLHRAVIHGRTEIAIVLIESGANTGVSHFLLETKYGSSIEKEILRIKKEIQKREETMKAEAKRQKEKVKAQIRKEMQALK